MRYNTNNTIKTWICMALLSSLVVYLFGIMYMKQRSKIRRLERRITSRYDENVLASDALPLVNERLAQAISKHAQNNVIILSITDFGFVEMAENLYLSSFKRFNITNYLFVCSHEKAEQYLTSRNINAISLWNDSISINESFYGEYGYRYKTNFKTITLYMALSLNYTSILVDVDIAFFRDPIPHIMRSAKEHDLIIQSEYGKPNSGFYVATNAGPARELHARMLVARDKRLRKGKILHTDQYYLNKYALDEMKGRIRVELLPMDLFAFGKHYFTVGNREFAGDNDTTQPFILHPTGNSGAGAKRYKLREFLLWHVDHNGYYSSTERKYITFELPVDLAAEETQRKTLIAGFELATLLNRTLILPEFHCKDVHTPNHHCNCATLLGAKTFALDEFEGLYREHVFLHHPLVPQSVRQSQSPIISLTHIVTNDILEASDLIAVKSTLKVLEKYSVIRLSDLHTKTIHYNSPSKDHFERVILS